LGINSNDVHHVITLAGEFLIAIDRKCWHRNPVELTDREAAAAWDNDRLHTDV